MKKIVSVLLCLVVCLSVFSFNLSAATAPSITVGNVSGVPGTVVNVPISIEDNPGILAMAFCVLYDNNVLEYVDYTKGYLTNYTLTNHSDKGIVSFVNVEEQNMFNNDTMITLSFKIKDNAAYNKYDITLANNNPDKYGSSFHNSFANASEQFIIPTVVNGSITVTDTPSLPDDPNPPEVSTDPTFYATNATTAPGQTFQVDIAVKNNPGFISTKLAIGYDSSVLEIVNAEGKDFSNVAFSPLTKNPINVNWVDSINPNNTTNGVLATLTVKVKDNAPDGDYNITISYDPEDVYDENFSNVSFVTESGIVTVEGRVSGDVNGDGKVNNRDLGLLMQYLNAWEVTINKGSADVNGDGAVNNKDYGLLMQYLNNWDVTLK